MQKNVRENFARSLSGLKRGETFGGAVGGGSVVCMVLLWLLKSGQRNGDELGERRCGSLIGQKRYVRRFVNLNLYDLSP